MIKVNGTAQSTSKINQGSTFVSTKADVTSGEPFDMEKFFSYFKDPTSLELYKSWKNRYCCSFIADCKSFSLFTISLVANLCKKYWCIIFEY